MLLLALLTPLLGAPSPSNEANALYPATDVRPVQMSYIMEGSTWDMVGFEPTHGFRCHPRQLPRVGAASS